MTIPVVRKRAKRPKTRTGCRTCRARHIKCDEARPQCGRCVASHRECAGYDAVRESASRNQYALLPKGGAGGGDLPMLCPLARPANISIQMTSQEAHAYDFFRSHTVNQLPGSGWTLSWERLALQVGHHEPAVTHAAVALGSIHRAIFAQAQPGSLGFDQEQHHFALSQYNKALGLVRRYIEALEGSASNHNVEVVLLVSLLFFCFEILHNEDARAVLHLRTGLRILYERVRHLEDYRSSAKMIDVEGEEKRVVRMQTRPRNNLDILLQTFIRLDGDLTIIGDEEPYLFPVCHESIPAAFHSLEEAMVHLDTIATAGHGICRNIAIMADKLIAAERPELDDMDEDVRNCLACAYSRTIPIDEEHTARLEKVKNDMNAWMSASAFLPASSAPESAQLLTHIHFFYTWFIVLSWRDESEMLVDRFDEQFDHVLTLTERYVKIHGSFMSPEGPDTLPPSSTLTRQAFTVGTDLVPCINMIAFKSRNSKIRRRCIQLLQTINLAGVFDGHYLAAFAQAVVDVEEQRARAINGIPSDIDLLCHQVPEEARLIEIELSPISQQEDTATSFYKKDTGRLVYVFYKDPTTRELEVAEKIFPVPRPTSADAKGAIHHRCDEWDDAFADFVGKFPLL